MGYIVRQSSLSPQPAHLSRSLAAKHTTPSSAGRLHAWGQLGPTSCAMGLGCWLQKEKCFLHLYHQEQPFMASSAPLRKWNKNPGGCLPGLPMPLLLSWCHPEVLSAARPVLSCFPLRIFLLQDAKLKASSSPIRAPKKLKSDHHGSFSPLQFSTPECWTPRPFRIFTALLQLTPFTLPHKSKRASRALDLQGKGRGGEAWSRGHSTMRHPEVRSRGECSIISY